MKDSRLTAVKTVVVINQIKPDGYKLFIKSQEGRNINKVIEHTRLILKYLDRFIQFKSLYY